MCLIVLDWNHDTKRLVLASNRDEYYNRPSQSAHYWCRDREDGRDVVYGGRDSQLGGTWLACSSSSNKNRLAAVTNFFTISSRLGVNQPRYPFSRGDLVYSFVSASPMSSSMSTSNEDDDNDDSNNNRNPCISAKEYCQEIERNHHQYGGFCAFLMDGTSLYYCTNRKQPSTTIDEDEYQFEYYELKTGTYGLSSHLLDTPWPKILKAKEGLTRGIEIYLKGGSCCDDGDDDDDIIKGATQTRQELLANYLIDNVMEDTDRVNDRHLLPTTLNPEEEYMRSSIFVKGGSFGTRTTTIVVSENKQCNSQQGYYGFHVTEKNHITPYVSTSSTSYQFVRNLSS